MSYPAKTTTNQPTNRQKQTTSNKSYTHTHTHTPKQNKNTDLPCLDECKFRGTAVVFTPGGPQISDFIVVSGSTRAFALLQSRMNKENNNCNNNTHTHKNPSVPAFGGRCKMGQIEKKEFKNIYLTALGNVHEVRKKALLFHCGGQELHGTIFQTFDEQFAALGGVRPTVSDGLYSNCIRKMKYAQVENRAIYEEWANSCLLYTSPSPRDRHRSRMPSYA